MAEPARPTLPPPPPANSAQAESPFTAVPLTPAQAAVQAGLLKPYDAAMAAVILLCWVLTACWKIFGTPTALDIIAMILANIVFTQFWLISLVYRCAWFVLQTRADINLLPFESARLAANFMTGGRV
jgi:small-conductance mechanosensitive channel